MRSPSPLPGQITLLLDRWSSGDEEAFHELVPLVYARLRKIARQLLVAERPGHILQPTALVNEHMSG
jgi:hypothetical protein